MLKSAVKSLLPKSLFDQVKSGYYNAKLSRVKAAFDNAGTEPDFLDYQVLEKLHQQYKFNTDVSYDPQALLQRGEERYKYISGLLEGNRIGKSFEVGCGDGMVSAVFADHGVDATAADFDRKMFDARASEMGVRFLVSEAEKIPEPENTYDLVFSYNAFEHIMHPDAAFLECLRILKPGGHLYLTFNPLFFAPMGFHSYKSTQVPYLQILFDTDTINKFIEANKLPDITFSYTALNKWTIGQFRKLFRQYEHLYSPVLYYELKDFNGLELIKKYPACFKHKSKDLDDFVVSGIELLIIKK